MKKFSAATAVAIIVVVVSACRMIETLGGIQDKQECAGGPGLLQQRANEDSRLDTQREGLRCRH